MIPVFFRGCLGNYAEASFLSSVLKLLRKIYLCAMKFSIHQEGTMFKKIIYIISIVVPLNFLLCSVNESFGADYKTSIPSSVRAANSVSVNMDETRPVLVVTPREIDLGTIEPDETASGVFNLKNVAPGMMSWSTSCPEGWEGAAAKTLHGSVSSEPEHLRLELKVAENIENLLGDKSRIPAYRTSMRLEAGGKELICYRILKAGGYRMPIRLMSVGGQRNIFVNFRIHAQQGGPSINLNPQRLDLGVQPSGKIISKRIELTNKGRAMLKWSVVPRKETSADLPEALQKARYFSFHADELLEPGKYVIPEHLKDDLELIGKWSEKNGYPVSKGATASLKFRFQGKGVSFFLQSHSKDGHCSVYLDEEMINLPDVLSGQWEKKELLIAEGLADGLHAVTIVARDGSLEIEGVKVFGKEIMRGPKGWLTVFPNSGTTITETDYLNVKADMSNLAPGYYSDEIVFKSNTGEEKAEVFVEVIHDSGHKIIDVYLYSKDVDYLFTVDPQAEAQRLIQNGYSKEGIAFRLFAPDTPGTKSFYRWYNPVKKDHYYHYDRSGGGKSLRGYVYEGMLGNIATSRLTNTRELYRWFNPSTGRHYYSTHTTISKRGYRFDGIAGYVR